MRTARLNLGAASAPYRCRRWFAGSSSLHMVVLGMGSDPVPENPLRRLHTYGPVVLAHPHGPMPSDLLEVQGRMTRAFLQEGEVLVGQLLDVDGRPVVVFPEVGGSVMTHNSEQRP